MCCQTQRAARSMTCAADSRFQALTLSEAWIQYMKHCEGTPRRGTRGHGLPSGTLKMSGTMPASDDETEITWPHHSSLHEHAQLSCACLYNVS